MKFYPVFSMCCGECGYVVLETKPRFPSEAGTRKVRCTNRGCVAHGKVFQIEVAALEAVEVVDEPA